MTQINTLFGSVAVHPNTEQPETLEGQGKRILAYLKTGQRITPMKALQLFGCFRLAARISDLRNSGHDITTEIVKVKGGKKVASYFLK